MNALCHRVQATLSPPVIKPMSTGTARNIDRAALAAAAADRRAKLDEISAAMEAACETAVRRACPYVRDSGRENWNRRAWARYVDEAIHQARLHADEISALRRDAERLDHLVACFSPVHH
jgi:hypothetical protein